MKVIQTQTEIGDDHVLRLALPDDAPTGLIEVLVVLAEPHQRVSQEERRIAARAGRGMLSDTGLSSDVFLAERHSDERRRDRALG